MKTIRDFKEEIKRHQILFKKIILVAAWKIESRKAIVTPFGKLLQRFK